MFTSLNINDLILAITLLVEEIFQLDHKYSLSGLATFIE